MHTLTYLPHSRHRTFIPPCHFLDYVQNTATATTKWGDIGDWDTSGVGDFSYAFTQFRNQAGGSFARGGNPKAATFVGTAISKWDTASATSLFRTFWGASEMNADLTGWKVGKVVSLHGTFLDASKFTGTGLASWDTSSVTTLFNTFYDASEMNANLTGWTVGKVVTLGNTFRGASKFVGTGLASWDTSSVTSLEFTFDGVSEMNSDLTGWKVDKVITLYNTFYSASKFVGTGLNSWNTASVTTLYYTFRSAGNMNADLSTWNIAKVSSITDTFTSTPSLSSCNKRKIADAWKSSNIFTATTYDEAWATDACTVRFE